MLLVVLNEPFPAKLVAYTLNTYGVCAFNPVTTIVPELALVDVDADNPGGVLTAVNEDIGYPPRFCGAVNEIAAVVPDIDAEIPVGAPSGAIVVVLTIPLEVLDPAKLVAYAEKLYVVCVVSP
jgi:hypothetical protein